VPSVRVADIARRLPPALYLPAAAGAVALLLLLTLGYRLVAAPSWSVAYANLTPEAASEVMLELDERGVPYRLAGNGTRIEVPDERLDRVRLDLAAEGVSASPAAPGYELLDDQPMSVSAFRQQVDFRRAMEGELARTLTSMTAIDSASVHLVVPERRLFTTDDTEPTASVLLQAHQELHADEVDMVTNLVASAVEGLSPSQVTVAAADGQVLQAAGEQHAAGHVSWQLRHTAELEQHLAGRTGELLATITSDVQPSVVVTAELDFDDVDIEEEAFSPDEGVVLREDSTQEQYDESGAADAGELGVDGGVVEPDLPASGQITSESSQETREFAYDRTVTRTQVAAGQVQRLSVGVVMDDGSLTEAPVPDEDAVVALVTAAVGLDADRGDTVEVQFVPFPAPDAEPELPEAEDDVAQMLQLGAAAFVLVLTAVILGLLAWRRRPAAASPAEERDRPVAAAGDVTADVPEDDDDDVQEQQQSQMKQVLDVASERPGDVAALLRTWLADR